MGQMTTKNSQGHDVLRGPVRCVRCDEECWSPASAGESLAAYIADYEVLGTVAELAGMKASLESKAEKIIELNVKNVRLRDERDTAIADLSGHCEFCASKNDCVKFANCTEDARLTWWTACVDWKWYRSEVTKCD